MTTTFLKFVFKCIIFITLTIITQFGGIVYLLHKIIVGRFKNLKFYYKPLFFIALYLIGTFFIVPKIALKFGREKIENTENLKPQSFLYVLCNRNYVKPKINKLLKTAATQIKELDQNLKITYLDASFPFFDGFNLLPHLSHNDGKKLDLSFVYVNENGNFTNKKKSRSGYGIYEKPLSYEMNKLKTCNNLGYKYYDFTKHFTFGEKNKNLQFSEIGTKKLVEILISLEETKLVFIEPHLKIRLNLTNAKVKYQGCKAVRHDDHIHWEIK